MSGRHTDGLLKVQRPHAGERGWEIVDASGLGQVCQGVTEANARRLMACWNACDGFDTDDLEACPAGGLAHLATQTELLVIQLDDLLVAAQATLSNNLHLADGNNCTLIDIRRAVERITGVEV